jgi:hypothetical protein
MPKRKQDEVPRLVVPKNATMRQIYARAREEFTAADLQKYTEVEPMIPMEQVIAELEETDRREASRKRRVRRNTAS